MERNAADFKEVRRELLTGQLLKKNAPMFYRCFNERIRLIYDCGLVNSERRSNSAKAQKLNSRIGKLSQLIRAQSNPASSSTEIVMNAGDSSTQQNASLGAPQHFSD